ncbi:unnamed protein product [Rangifer tarandus platyrhynchus]|uniref:Uncharacterized protein n=1 Tax=Rangifer tarandus platyrhynchus TaxID=3082113 RepID=A0AC59Z4D2_RANTA
MVAVVTPTIMFSCLLQFPLNLNVSRRNTEQNQRPQTAGVSELYGPHQQDSSLSDLQTGVGGSTQNERDMCPAGPSPTSKVPALPTYLRTSTISVSSSNNEHPCPLCL